VRRGPAVELLLQARGVGKRKSTDRGPEATKQSRLMAVGALCAQWRDGRRPARDAQHPAERVSRWLIRQRDDRASLV
jgi:hypothetical protein